MIEESLDYSYLEKKLLTIMAARIETALARARLVEPLASAVTHAVLPTGKCIRPLLALMICRDLGGDELTFIDSAISIELTHCASLVHDDLPALDDDDERRGRPSCHKAFGEGTAVLAGDLLYSLAVQLLANAGDFDDRQRVANISALSGAYIEVLDGQQCDLSGAENEEELLHLYFKKTGSLFAAAVRMGVIAAGLPRSVQQLGERFGMWIGLYFQVSDDLIDVYGTDEQRGRAGSSDERNNRNTSARVEGRIAPEDLLDRARREIMKLLEELAQHRHDSGQGIGAEVMGGTTYVLQKIFSRGEIAGRSGQTERVIN